MKPGTVEIGVNGWPPIAADIASLVPGGIWPGARVVVAVHGEQGAVVRVEYVEPARVPLK